MIKIFREVEKSKDFPDGYECAECLPEQRKRMLSRGWKLGTPDAPRETANESGEPDSIQATEAARELAAANDVDLGDVVGTGADGSIKKSDVEAFIAERDAD